MSATDADSDLYNTVSYRLSFGLDDASEFTRSIFEINSQTGEITAKRAVDREKNSEFQLKVIAENTVAGMFGRECQIIIYTGFIALGESYVEKVDNSITRMHTK